MKKLVLPAIATLIASCSTDKTSDLEDLLNIAPTITTTDLQVNEHSLEGTSIGSISFHDDNTDDELTISSDSDAFFINQITGEVTVSPNAILDFESEPQITFPVSVFDGTEITEGNINLNLQDIEEYNALSTEQKEFADYFKYLALWEDSNSLETIQKWGAPMKLFLDGTITTEYRATVQSVLDQYNALFTDGDFSITIVNTEAQSNAQLYFGEASEIEGLWDDMFEIIDGNTFNGYAISSGNNFALNTSRIWVSSTVESLLKHELGHALGLGHSNKCDSENSFMCSTISENNDFLEAEEHIIRYLYHADMVPGTTAAEVNHAVSNLILLDQ